MYKERLQEIITERFVNDKISTDKYVKLNDRIDLMTEGMALDYLNEFKLPKLPSWKAVKAGAAGKKESLKATWNLSKNKMTKAEAIKMLQSQLANKPKGSKEAKAIQRKIFALQHIRKAAYGGAALGAGGVAGGAYAYGKSRK